ncbi:MAG: nicotinate-nucleotide--dimethylbenzimidazole phosphoribosyltransferase [Lachnospiraceae bacterium]|nr:nicotinate-nucleotide--dimethylbenzimidazole phosphoribosyltransferase [Lachnospiraceae bacterium]
MERLKDWKAMVEPFDEQARAQAKEKWDAIAKPLDGLGQLETMVTLLAGMQKTTDVRIDPATLYIFCADNGVIEEGISQSGAEVTAAVAKSMAGHNSSVCKMADLAHVETVPVDIGMLSDISVPGLTVRKTARGTKNFLREPAMTEEEVLSALQCGWDLAKESADAKKKLLLTGEMGIGNTTTAAALAAALLALPAESVCGRGAGLSDAKLERKKYVVTYGLTRYRYGKVPVTTSGEAFSLLCNLGGLDIAGMCGLFIGGACHGVPVVIDGAISAIAALLAKRIVPGCERYMLASHIGREPMMHYLLREIGVTPVIAADLALGEGTGAVMLVPLLQMALAVYHTDTVFSELSMEPYRRYDV